MIGNENRKSLYQDCPDLKSKLEESVDLEKYEIRCTSEEHSGWRNS
jgi:hypothetical protein